MIRSGRRRPGEPELLGARDAAEILGVAQTNLRTLKGLPEPYDKVSATTLWRKSDIERFAKTTGRLPEKTPTQARAAVVVSAIETAFTPID
jgi:hypothetical protein